MSDNWRGETSRSDRQLGDLSDMCHGHAQEIRGCEKMVMWRSGSRNGGILGINRLEAT